MSRRVTTARGLLALYPLACGEEMAARRKTSGKFQHTMQRIRTIA
jgi:hypothetical protein